MPDKVMLIAHPDDEVLFLWPFLKEVSKIVCCVDDRYNPERQWCRQRGDAFMEVCKYLGVEGVNLGLNSEFYRLNARNGDLHRALALITPHIKGKQVYTHNSHGEYGHLDHILCHSAALLCAKRLWTTTICTHGGWFPADWEEPLPYFAGGWKLPTADASELHTLKAIYDKYGCWTWSQPFITETEVGYI